ncbi:MAG TPA: FAD-dependent oxidoreductase [Puia sp.]|jgi:gamma-glutamylputrescine oxidase|nr:FAD-dependent oxidoreductase [Puia sp.]
MLPVSIWEKESFFAPRDIIIVGSGFTGLWSAYYLKKRYPEKSVLILEKGIIPSGASSRNAGFACFGSFSELQSDSNTLGESEMLALMEMRFKGLEKIRKKFSHSPIDYENLGGYELLPTELFPDINALRTNIDSLNNKLQKITGKQKTFQLNDSKIKSFGLGGSHHLIENKLEAQLHSGKLLEALVQLVYSVGVTILTHVDVKKMEVETNRVRLETNLPVILIAEQVLICTNAFAKSLLPDLDITPARGQILLTEPIDGLKIKGAFHFDEGFYYFRNLGNRILLGGARNKFIHEEETFSTDTSESIQQELEKFMKEIILPGISYQVSHRWSGTMAVGKEKKPIIQKINECVFCAVRMSGMGVALAPQLAKQVAGMM